MKLSWVAGFSALSFSVLALVGCDQPVRDEGPIPTGRVERIQQAIPIDYAAPDNTILPPECYVDGDCPPQFNPCYKSICEAGICKIAENNGAACNDGKSCTSQDLCNRGICEGNVNCPAPSQCHDVGTCDGNGACTNPPKPPGSTCNDGKTCTSNDQCSNGACSGSVSCPAIDQCHDAGSCDPTGACTRPNKADGTTCSDGNLCTRTDACQTGSCVGNNQVVCTAQSQCHNVGTCSPTTGTCSSPPKALGTTCSDGNLCTYSDSCNGAGTCNPGTSVTCTSDQCNTRACNGTQTCTVTPKTGALCDDTNLCSYADKCTTAGTCAGTTIVCTSDDTATRTCNGTQTCTVTPKAGAACDDSDPCTKGDVRQTDGSCGGMRYSCPVTACLNTSTCDGNGGCTSIAKPDGTLCDADQDKCTPKDACKGGECLPDPKPLTCVVKDCNTVACNPGTGNCDYRPTTGGACGVTGCYSSGTCQNGSCSGMPKNCSQFDSPCTSGICDAATGDCVASPKPNGSSCNAGLCAAGAVCAFGVCDLAPATCPAATGPCKVPACDPGNGRCIENSKPAGAPCDPKNSCMMGAVCDMQGACNGTPAPNGEACTGEKGIIGSCVLGTCVVSGEIGGTGGADAGAGDAPYSQGGQGGRGGQGGSQTGGTGGSNSMSGEGGGCTIAGSPRGSFIPLALAAFLWVATRRIRRRP